MTSHLSRFYYERYDRMMVGSGSDTYNPPCDFCRREIPCECSDGPCMCTCGRCMAEPLPVYRERDGNA